MRTFLLILCVLPFLLQAQSYHLGTWQGEDKGDMGQIILSSDGSAVFIHEQDTIGGNHYMINEMLVELKYTTDYTKSPYQINFYFEMADGTSVQFMKGIFHLLDPETMDLCADFEGKEFPKTFEKEDTIRLSKQ